MRDTVAFIGGVVTVLYGLAVVEHWVTMPSPESVVFLACMALANTIWLANAVRVR